MGNSRGSGSKKRRGSLLGGNNQISVKGTGGGKKRGKILGKEKMGIDHRDSIDGPGKAFQHIETKKKRTNGIGRKQQMNKFSQQKEEFKGSQWGRGGAGGGRTG